jgi:hypothetical protein
MSPPPAAPAIRPSWVDGIPSIVSLVVIYACARHRCWSYRPTASRSCWPVILNG